TYTYKPDGYTRDFAVQEKIYDIALGVRRTMAEMDYSGMSGKEKIVLRTAYERDGVTEAGITTYAYDSLGRMAESNLKVKIGSGAEVLMNKTIYKGEEGEEQIDRVEHYEPIPGGERITTENYVYDQVTHTLLRTETYDEMMIIETVRKYGQLLSPGTGIPSGVPLQGEEVLSEILTYYMDGSLKSRTKYVYQNYAIDRTETYDSANNLSLFTEYSGIEGDEKVDHVEDHTALTKTEYIYASAAGYACPGDAPLERQDTYDMEIGGILSSKTYFAVPSGGLRGQENRDYTEQIEPDGTKASKTEFYYGAYLSGGGYSTVPASQAGKYDPLRRTDYYYYYGSGALSPLVNATFYVGYKGNEQRDYARTYELDGVTTRETITYVYDQFGALDKVVNTIGLSQIVASETDYYGVKGKEKVGSVVTYSPGGTAGAYPPGMKLDINGDGLINDLDVYLLQESLTYNLDIDSDGRYDYNDLEMINNIISALGLVNDDQALLNSIYVADLNGDGDITEDEVEAMREHLRNIADVDLNGEYNAADLDAIQNIIAFLNNFDSDGDGESDQDEYINGSDPFNSASNSGETILSQYNLTAAAAQKAVEILTGAASPAGTYGLPGSATLTVGTGGTATITNADGKTFDILPAGALSILAGGGEGMTGAGVLGGAIPLEIGSFIVNYVQGIPSAGVEDITARISAFFNDVKAVYDDGYGDETLLSMGTMLAVTNPGMLTDMGISTVSSWLLTQGARIVNCAAKALIGLFTLKNVPEEAQDIAASAIIADILTGVITEATSGDLATSLYTAARLSEVKGLPLIGLETDLDSIKGINPPFIAVIEEEGAGHMVLVKKVTDTAVVYESDGVITAKSYQDFKAVFSGVTLVAKDVIETMVQGDKTRSVTPAGIEIGFTLSKTGEVLSITANLASGETTESVLSGIRDRSLAGKAELETYLTELKRLKENSATTAAEASIDGQIKTVSDEISRLSNFTRTLNGFISRIAFAMPASQADEASRTLRDGAATLKSEIAALKGTAHNANIRDANEMISQAVQKKLAIEKDYYNLLIMAQSLATIDPTVSASVKASADVVYQLLKDAETLILAMGVRVASIPDKDGDTYSDAEEKTAKTNSLDHKDTPVSKVDTDEDGYSDSLEVYTASDPNDIAITPDNADLFDVPGTGRVDTDEDGVPDWLEDLVGSDKYSSDTDSDGFTDYEELKLGTDPLDPDNMPASEDLKDLVHAPSWRMGMISLDSLTRADINGDGLLDVKDIIALSNMMTNFADLTGDRKLN
ncbi:MAG: hypothetical protein PHT95_05440, partial [Candidatus Omnitrophica bacterium]|nr:hypothetical protein [Candidatus Omnitrophota bacterium]